MKLLRFFGAGSYSPRRYHVILWWEIARIPFNIIMLIAGWASFYISFVTIPLVYIVIGLLINFGYTLNWIIELIVPSIVTKLGRKKFRMYFFWGYLVLSIVFVFGVSLIPFLT